MKVKASNCFFDVKEGVIRRPTDTFEVTPERASFLLDKDLIEPYKQEKKEKKIISKEK